jgi:hypothetical protein
MMLMVMTQKIRHLLRNRLLSVYMEEDEELLSVTTRALEEF